MTERKKIVFLDSDEDTGGAVVTIGAGGVRTLEIAAPDAGLPLDVDPADFEDPTNPINFDAMVSRAEAEAEAEAAEGGVLSFVEDATAVPMPSAAEAVRAAGWVPSRVVTAHGATEAPFEGAFASMHSRVTPGPRMPAGLGLGLGMGGMEDATRALRDLMTAPSGGSFTAPSRRRPRDGDEPAASGAGAAASRHSGRHSGADDIPDVPMSALLPSPDRDDDTPVAPPRSYPVTSTLMRFVDSSDEDQDAAVAAAATAATTAAIVGVDATAVDWDAMITNAGADGIPSLVAAAPTEPTSVRREGHADGRSVVQVVDSYRLTLDERDYLDTSVDDLVMNRSTRGQLTFAARAFLAEQETLVGGASGAQRGARNPTAARHGAVGSAPGEVQDAEVAPPATGGESGNMGATENEGDYDVNDDDEAGEEGEEESDEAELDDAIAVAAVEQLIAVCVAELQRDGESDPIAAALSGAYSLIGSASNVAAPTAAAAADPNAPVEFVDARAAIQADPTAAAAGPTPVAAAAPPPAPARASIAVAAGGGSGSDDDDDDNDGAAAVAVSSDMGAPSGATVSEEDTAASGTAATSAGEKAAAVDVDADAAPSRPPPLRAFRHFLAVAVPALRDVQSGKTAGAAFVQAMEGPMFRMQRALVMWNRPTAAPKIVIDGKVMDL